MKCKNYISYISPLNVLIQRIVCLVDGRTDRKHVLITLCFCTIYVFESSRSASHHRKKTPCTRTPPASHAPRCCCSAPLAPASRRPALSHLLPLPPRTRTPPPLSPPFLLCRQALYAYTRFTVRLIDPLQRSQPRRSQRDNSLELANSHELSP